MSNKKLPKGWIQVSPTRIEFKSGKYFPRVCGKPLTTASYSYTVVVTLTSEHGIDVDISDEEAPSVPGGAYLSHTIPAAVYTRLLSGETV